MAKDPVKSNEKENVRERSFGAAPPKIKIQGGDMCTFGHKNRAAVWPKPTDTVDSKTGYPEGHMNGKAAIEPK